MITYRVVDWGDGVALQGIELPDHSKWALAVGNPQLSRSAALRMMRTNMNVLLRHQGKALRLGPCFVAPLKLDHFEVLGGESACTVSRVFNGASIAYQGETFSPSYLVSPASVDGVELSGVQVRAACLAAIGLLGESTSDQKVADLMARVSVPIARRTVSKYKSAEEHALAIPTPRFRDLLGARLATLRDENGFRTFVDEMLAHNRGLLAAYDGDRANALSAEVGVVRDLERFDLREWLLEERVGRSASRAAFAALPLEQQMRVVDGMLEALTRR